MIACTRLRGKATGGPTLRAIEEPSARVEQQRPAKLGTDVAGWQLIEIRKEQPPRSGEGGAVFGASRDRRAPSGAEALPAGSVVSRTRDPSVVHARSLSRTIDLEPQG